MPLMRNALLLLLCLLLYGSAFLVPHSVEREAWIPMVAGLVEGDFLSGGGVWSILFALLSALLIALGTYILMDSDRSRRQESLFAALVTLALLFADSKNVYYNQLYPVVMCNFASGYNFLKRKYMNAFLLLSLSSLFYIPILWAIPLSLIILFLDTTDIWRNLAKACAGIALPYIYLLSFRFILFGDALEFVEANLEELLNIGGGFYRLPVPSLFLVLCIIASGLYFTIFSLRQVPAMETDSAKLTRYLAMDLLLCGVISLLYVSKNGLPFTLLFSISFGSLAASCSLLAKGNRRYAYNVLMLFLLLSALLARCAHFVAV